MIIQNIKKLTAIDTKKKNTKISLIDFLKINIAGQVNKERQIKLKEYVPIIDNICIKYLLSEKLNAIKFHGNPVKINPLINSIDPNKAENNKNETIIFLE